jgi:hypothetical protein
VPREVSGRSRLRVPAGHVFSIKSASSLASQGGLIVYDRVLVWPVYILRDFFK